MTFPVIRMRGSRVALEEDSIIIEPYQLNRIRRYANTRTKRAIRKSTGCKIRLTHDQKEQLLVVKNLVLQQLSPSFNAAEILRSPQGFGFENHSCKRILQRIERYGEDEIKLIPSPYFLAVHPETLENLVETLVNATEVDNYAYWKAYPYLTFSFTGDFEDRKIKVSLTFENGILIITVVNTFETGYYIREVRGVSAILKNTFSRK